MKAVASACSTAACLVLVAACGGATGSSATQGQAGRHQVASPSSTAGATAAGQGRPTHVSAAYADWRLPLRVSRAAVIAVGGDSRHILLAGGMLPGDSSTDRVTELDPVTGRTAPGPALAIAVHDAAGGLVRGAPAVFGGGNATEQSVVQALHGRTWRSVAHLPTTRSDLSVVPVDGGSLVIGGYDGSHVPRQVLRLGRRLTAFATLSRGVRYAATAVVDRSVYVFGGEVDHQELDVVQRLDLDTHRTKIVARLPRPLGHASAVAVGGRVLLLGGRTAPDRQSGDIWWFDPVTNRFRRAGKLPAPLSDASVVSAGRRLWLLGGEDPQVTDRVVVVRVS